MRLFRQYFNIEEEQIVERVKSAILLRPVFSEVIRSQPDLYGPFWISTTLIIVLVASSSLMVFFSNDDSHKYDFEQLSVAALLVFIN